MTVEIDEDFLFAVLEFAKFKDAAWKEASEEYVISYLLGADVGSTLIEFPAAIPEPNIQSAQADIFFEALQLQPMSLELSFMRTDRVNVDEK
jgi:vacuolar protein sorting-associated protein 13A/C